MRQYWYLKQHSVFVILEKKKKSADVIAAQILMTLYKKQTSPLE